MKDYKVAVFIGRFQPFHNSHKEVVEHGLKIAEKVIVVVGSANAATNIKNPWTYKERQSMILGSMNSARVTCVPVRDYFYSDYIWIADIQSKINEHVNYGDSVALLGNYKDNSSYYLKYFPQWDFIPVKTVTNINATDIRKTLFTADNLHDVKHLVSDNIFVTFKEMNKNDIEHETRLDKLKNEYNFLEDYKSKWSHSPFPPTFVTVDNVVVCSGHILLIQRKMNPGKNLYALPGGFVKQDETLKNAALRELKEETGIRIDKTIYFG